MWFLLFQNTTPTQSDNVLITKVRLFHKHIFVYNIISKMLDFYCFMMNTKLSLSHKAMGKYYGMVTTELIR